MVYNPYIVVPLATWAITQVAKFAIAAIKGRIDFRYLYASGGMPSVHSAVVSSLAVTSLLIDGAGSHIFGFVVIVAVIVMYDSFGVRRSTGEQAVALNMLFENLERSRIKFDGPMPKLREILGHQPREVSAGAVTGIVLGGLFNYDHLGAFATFFQALPGQREMWAYLGIFVALVVLGVIVPFVLGRRYPKSRVIKRFRSRIFTAAETVGWLGIVSFIFVYEHANYLSWRLWPVLVIIIGVFWGVWIVTGPAKTVPEGLAAEAMHARKTRWLKFRRKR